METINELLDAVKQKAGVESNNAIAGILGVRRQRVTDFYAGERTPDNIVCKRIAEYLDRPLPQIIAVVGAESEKDEVRKAEWQNYYKSIGGYAASIMLGIFFAVTLIVTPTPAEAAPLLDSNMTTLCIMLSLWSIFRSVISSVLSTPTNELPRSCFSG